MCVWVSMSACVYGGVSMSVHVCVGEYECMCVGGEYECACVCG